MALPRAFSARLRALPPVAGLALTLGWMALIFLLSAQPPSQLARSLGLRAWLSNLAHAPEYGALTLFALIAVRRPGTPLGAARGALLGVLLFALAHGALDELHQSFVPGRDPSVLDTLTDLCGATTAAACVRAVQDPERPGARLRLALVLGVPACMLSATLATVLGGLYPEIEWL